MRLYKKFKYIFPPRPVNAIPPTLIDKYDNGEFIAQPKLNGDCAELYINNDSFRNFNRHKKEGINHFKLKSNEIMKLNSGSGYMVLCGEYMNKSKKDSKGVWNHKFVIWDILVYNGKHLIGSTFEERVEILDDIYGKKEYSDYLYEVSENVFRVKTFTKDFTKKWRKITKIDMFEGFVFKRKKSKLADGRSSKNNHLGQFKSRKPMKNYEY